jgi:hypothetical protein
MILMLWLKNLLRSTINFYNFMFKNPKLRISKFFLLSLIILSQGCAPGVGTSVELTYLPDLVVDDTDSKYLSKLEGLQFSIDKVLDDRISKDALDIQSRKVQIEGSLPLLVKDSFRDAITKSGGIIENLNNNSIKLSVRIIKWDVKVNSKFPSSTTKSNCELEVKVNLSKLNTFTVVGKGNSQREDPLLSENDILLTFGEALNEAVIGALVKLSLLI